MVDGHSQVPLPERVGRYEVLLPIASGGMATVYLARARGAGGFERDVALKLTHAHLRETAEFARDLLEEAKLAVRIRHANVVPVIDLGDDPHGLFLVMEYIEGDTLSGLSRRAAAAGTPLDPAISLRILLDGLAGLHCAHELADDDGRPLGIVHRDFSPQNILVGTDGVGRLADFGIAKAVSRVGSTRTGNVKGKIAYMAPEQARGKSVDRRCDVWAAGVLAWELIAGRRLYSSESDEIGTLFRIATEVPPRLSSVRGDVAPALEEAVAHALTHDLGARCPTAAALARELSSALRSSSAEVADASDVAAIVARFAGPRLAARRLRAKEIVALRSELGRVAAQSSSDVATPGSFAAPAVPDPPSARVSEPTDVLSSTAALPVVEAPHTDVSAVSTGARRALANRRPHATINLLLLIGVAASMIGVLLLVRAFVSRDLPPEASSSSAAAASMAPASISPLPTAAEPPTPVVTAPPETERAAPPPASAHSASPVASAASRPEKSPAHAVPARGPSFLDKQH